MIGMDISHVRCPICKSHRVTMYKDDKHSLHPKYRCNDCGARWLIED